MPPRPVISTHSMGKRYLLGEGSGRTTLREALWTSALRRRRHRPADVHWAVRDVSLSVAQGETVGLIGPNGAGKSTLLRVLARITEPTEGLSRTRGRVAALLEVGTGFHHELTGRENVFLNGAILGMRRAQVQRRFDEIVAFADVARFLDTPVKRYSSGMHLRLAFAVAAHLDADILLVDEVLAVADADFQQRCLSRMSELEDEGRTVLFASHDLEAVTTLCPRTILMDGGVVRHDGPTPDVTAAYLAQRRSGFTQGSDFTDDPDAPVSIRDVQVRSGDGQASEVLAHDRALTVTVQLVLRRPTRGLHLGVTVRTPGGPRVLDETIVLPHDGDAAGIYQASLAVPAILNPGEYSVGLWVGTAYEDHVWVEEAVVVRLVGPTDGRPDRILQLRDPWSLVRLDSQ